MGMDVTSKLRKNIMLEKNAKPLKFKLYRNETCDLDYIIFSQMRHVKNELYSQFFYMV